MPDTAAAPARPKAADISAIAKREWEARQREERAAKLEAKYRPLDATLGADKKDLPGALSAMAKEYGVTFEDFVRVLTETAPAEKTAAQVAEEAVAAKLAERDAAAAKERQAADAREFEARETATRSSFVQQAEAGTPEDPNRWELTHVAGAGGTAWDVIWGHYQATAKFDEGGRLVAEGEKLTREQALDLIETKLREKQAARRTKQNPATVTADGNGRNEAAETQRTDGRAAAPSFTNRATSGIPAAVGAQAVDEVGLPDHEVIARIAARRGIRL